MLELGIAGGRAVPLQKRTVGNTNISDVFDGVNHIWPTRDDVAYFYDFNSIQLRFIWTDSNGRDFDTGTNITNAPSIPSEIVGWSWGSSENRTQPFLYWGGDNTQSGAECVMVDIKSNNIMKTILYISMMNIRDRKNTILQNRRLFNY